jgi:hypothetical protein
MIAALLLSFTPTSLASFEPLRTETHAAARPEARTEALVVLEDPELDAKIAAAGTDVAKLTALAGAYTSAGQDAEAKKVYRRIVELDANNEAAHKALNHQHYDKKWFESFAELAKYKREEAARMKEKGLARYKDEWIAEGDVPFLNMGWTKDAHGVWTNPVDAARAKEVADLTAAGNQFRADDSSWIAPADVEHWTAQQWKCGSEWVDMAKADEYHSKAETPWQLTGEHFVVWTTCDWAGGNLARWYADKCFDELVRIFGVAPSTKPRFVVLNSLAQYNQAAGGNPPTMPESEGFSSLHGAYFADQWVDLNVNPPQFVGAGVTFWDRKSDALKGWGPYWLRWAAGQSFVDAIDPSWSYIGDTIASGAGGGARPEAVEFWNEKKIPRWFRYGAASYVERYMKNPEAATAANTWDLRSFAFGELKKNGGIHKLDEIFAFGLDINKLENSTRLYHEAGLLVSFLLDGSDNIKSLKSSHEAFKAALKSGSKKDVAAAASDLQKELAAHEREIKTFAGI